MIYLQVGILILEIGLCMLLNNLLKNKFNKKIRYAICIALLLNYRNMRTYQAMWAIHTHVILFTNPIINIQEKKTNHLHTSFSYHIHIVTFGSVNMYTIHKTAYNITTTKEITNTKFLSTWQRLRG